MEKENLEKKDNISLTAYDITKNVINNIESLNINDEEVEKDLYKKLYRVIIQADKSKYFVMSAPYLKYITFFVNTSNKSKRDFTQEIVNFIKEEINNNTLGELKDYGYRKDSNALEIWLGDECYMIFNYEKGVVEI